MKELDLVILTCSFLSLVELAGKNVKVLERSMRKHKAFCSCAQKIIYKVTIDICSRILTKNISGWACRPQLEAMGRIVIWDMFVREIFMAKEVCWVSVQFSSVAQSCPTLCDPMNRSTPGLPVHHHLPEFTQTHVHRVSDAIQPSHPLLSPSPLPPIPPSIRVFSNESTLHMRWPKYWSFSLSIISSKEHPGLVSFRMDWLDLLALQGTLKSLLQHHSSKASILRCSAFFTV